MNHRQGMPLVHRFINTRACSSRTAPSRGALWARLGMRPHSEPRASASGPATRVRTSEMTDLACPGRAPLAVWNCSQMVTLAGPARARRGAEMRELAVVRDGAMLVRDGRIECVGSRAEIERAAGGDVEVVDAGGRT